jgi:NADH-quinone oxidoreductase subunit G
LPARRRRYIMPTLKIDGREVTIEKGRTIIQACEQLGIEVPRYCYHPGLRVVGSCRMCLVDIEKLPKLQIACNTPATDDMVVWTQNDKVKEARRSVLEFLLLNHPLDCPVCDRAGECELQNYYMKFAQHDSRLQENKVKKKKAFPIGPHVMLDQERCVLCSRCIRFTSEVSQTGELGIFHRGTYSEVNIYPGKELNNNYSGNVVDICPVGALLDRDFRYQMSVWYLKEQFSVCPGCSNGCNIRVHYNLDRRYKTEGRRVMRLKPRFNEHVNRYWMCDEGRYNYKSLDVDRLEEPKVRDGEALKSVEWEESISKTASLIKTAIDSHGPESVAILASPQMTNEEIFWVRKLFNEHLKLPNLAFAVPPKPEATSDNFLLKKDKNPNTKGAELILSEQAGNSVMSMLDSAVAGNIKLFYIFHFNLFDVFGDYAAQALNSVDTVIYQGTNSNPILNHADAVLPAAAYAEKEGTFTNFQGRVQRIFTAVRPLKQSRPSLEILHDLARALGLSFPIPDASSVFDSLASENPAFHGLNYTLIGLSGKLVNQPESAVAAD